MTKRFFDILIAGIVLFAILPFLLVICILIVIDSPGFPIFSQLRVGKGGRLFFIHKLRTMFVADSPGLLVTSDMDPRITAFGFFLRKYKIDELPQFYNVLIGNMSIVGPRPEVPCYIDFYPKASRDIMLSVRPGITDPASVLFRNESLLLASTSDPNAFYINSIIPVKAKFFSAYAVSESLRGDLIVILKTFKAILT